MQKEIEQMNTSLASADIEIAVTVAVNWIIYTKR
jgi:hypothetical protein